MVTFLRGAIFSFPPAKYETEVQAWIDLAAKPEGQGWTKQDYEMHVREEHSTFAWIVEGMIKQPANIIAMIASELAG